METVYDALPIIGSLFSFGISMQPFVYDKVKEAAAKLSVLRQPLPLYQRFSPYDISCFQSGFLGT